MIGGDWMASNGVANMREAIIGAYPGLRWRSRVNAMEDNQVIAIYNDFIRKGVFNKVRVPKKPSDPNFHQMTLWDYGIKRSNNGGTF